MSNIDSSCSFCRLIERYRRGDEDEPRYEDDHVIIQETEVSADHLLHKNEIIQTTFDGKKYEKIYPDYGNKDANEFFKNHSHRFSMDGLLILSKNHGIPIDKDYIRSLLSV